MARFANHSDGLIAPQKPNTPGRAQKPVQADQPAHRGSHDARVLALVPGAEPPIDLRLERLDDEVEVRVPLSTARPRVHPGAVLVAAVAAHVRDGDDDGLEPLRTEPLHRLVDPPLPGERQLGIEQVLAVVHVDDGVVAAAGLVRRGEVDLDVARVPQLRAADVRQHADVPDDVSRSRGGPGTALEHALVLSQAPGSGSASSPAREGPEWVTLSVHYPRIRQENGGFSRYRDFAHDVDADPLDRARRDPHRGGAHTPARSMPRNGAPASRARATRRRGSDSLWL